MSEFCWQFDLQYKNATDNSQNAKIKSESRIYQTDNFNIAYNSWRKDHWKKLFDPLHTTIIKLSAHKVPRQEHGL